MKKNVPFLSLKDVTAQYASEIHEAALRVIDSGRYLQGSENVGFEQAFADYTGKEYCVGCGNGLDALIWIFRAYKEMGILKKGDEVIVPANTYIASILAITENDLVPILVEPEYTTLEINGDILEGYITSRTKAVLIVHLYGRTAYSERIGEICEKHGLLLVQDCAQSHGLRIESKEHSDLLAESPCAYSFYPGKNLGALGDAGAVVTNNRDLADTVRSLANYGSARKYEFQYCGRNSRMDEIQAAILRVKLNHLDEEIRRRRDVAEYYYENIKNNLVTLPEHLDRKNNVYHLFPVLVKGEGNRDRLMRYLADMGVMTIIHYPIPPHHQLCYKDEAWNTPQLCLPVTERLAREELSLPMSPCLTREQLQFVVSAVNEFI